jgi:acyl dehydratase
VQNLLYRLTGDTNLIHVDPEYAKKMGLETSIMQGLCSFGFSCRNAIAALIPGEPERMTRMAAQMSSMLLPDTPVKLQLWKIGDGVAYFRFMNCNTGKAVLNRGVFEWKK